MPKTTIERLERMTLMVPKDEKKSGYTPYPAWRLGPFAAVHILKEAFGKIVPHWAICNADSGGYLWGCMIFATFDEIVAAMADLEAGNILPPIDDNIEPPDAIKAAIMAIVTKHRGVHLAGVVGDLLAAMISGNEARQAELRKASIAFFERCGRAP